MGVSVGCMVGDLGVSLSCMVGHYGSVYRLSSRTLWKCL